ncbi:polysaccharide deacetylase family protein [Streptomyces sp. NPDC046197]|uniref:polysaccharide deacetylase family protein n=1 Tax=Streptomyces sp. NPDC046197 TaxID=3154337 RepID=UPI0033C08D31
MPRPSHRGALESKPTRNISPGAGDRCVRNTRTATYRMQGAVTRVAAMVTAAVLTFGLCSCGGSNDVTPRAGVTGQMPSASGATTGPARRPGGSVDCRKAKCVALTFDDSPSVRTPQILYILRRYGAHATFFTLGKNHVMRYPVTVRRMAAEGHEVETLTWSHQILTEISPAEARKEIIQGRDAVARVIGRRPVLLRPPQGRTSAAITAICRQLGMAQVLWSASGSDYQTTDSALITSRILAQTGPGGIILLHDRVDPTNRGYNGTVAALPGLISTLEARGYTFVTVKQLLAPSKPRPGGVYQ